MRTYRIYQVDAFTTERFRGNPAGVVPEADGLSEADMLSIARELNNSETAFIFSPDGPDCDLQIRYFTPRVEVPICGHATIAAHYVRAVEQGTALGRSGLADVEVALEGGQPVRVRVGGRAVVVFRTEIQLQGSPGGDRF